MKNRNIILLVFGLFISQNTFSQLDTLNILESIASSSMSTNSDPEEVEDNNQRNDQINEDDEQNQITQDLVGENYSFQGKSTFSDIPYSKSFEQPLNYFGYDFFTNVPQSYTPIENIPVPPDYVIGPGDSLKIMLFGNKNEKYTLKVKRDGEIFFPEIGPINVAGLSFSDVITTLKRIVESKIIGTEISITLGTLRSINVFILGEALRPGMYTISALSSVTNALFTTGGINITGSLRNIQLKRDGETITTFDFYDLLLNGDASNDMRLFDGDVIFIPPKVRSAGIGGEVARPGIYELSEGEKLSDLLKFSGGLTHKASNLVDLTRPSKATRSFNLFSLNLDDPSLRDYQVSNGDVIKVYPLSNSMRNAILVRGHAKKSGFFPWKKGLTIKDIFQSSEDVLTMTDLNYVLIKRRLSKGQGYEFLQIDLAEMFNDIKEQQNIELFDQDEIILFPTLLTPDDIKTTLVQDKYILDKETNQMILEDEWESLTYLRKSIISEQPMISDPLTSEQPMLASQNPNIEEAVNRYYEYSVFNYCTIPESLAIEVVESAGFQPKKSIPMEQLEDLTTPEAFAALQIEIKKEAEETSLINNKDISNKITKICRDQLLAPIIDLVNRENNSDNILRMISVYGNVQFPGDYPFVDNMNLNDAIKAAGGARNATYNTEIEVSRRENIGKEFSLSSTYATLIEGENIDLQKMDIINLKQITSKIKQVEVTGEVFFPGVYPIAENQTLGELILRAGGLKDLASTSSAYFQRLSIKEAEEERLKRARSELVKKIVLSSQSAGPGQENLDSNSINQLTSLVSSSEEMESPGRLVIDLDSIMNGTVEDIILQDQDSIFIPLKKQSISVIGEVYVPNSHLYDDSNQVDDYIAMSGGINSFADEDNIYLIKADGSIISPKELATSGFFRDSSSQLNPGDTIVIPLQVRPFSGLKATTEITQIIYQMALAAAAANSF